MYIVFLGKLDIMKFRHCMMSGVETEDFNMCIFQTGKFELYPEQTQLHLGYAQESETARQWQARARLEKAVREEENFYRNANGQIPACELAERKAAERRHEYQA
jgi:hypothetical protein